MSGRTEGGNVGQRLVNCINVERPVPQNEAYPFKQLVEGDDMNRPCVSTKQFERVS
jgi:hypothetical protein